jgi:hypothetical protein
MAAINGKSTGIKDSTIPVEEVAPPRKAKAFLMV